MRIAIFVGGVAAGVYVLVSLLPPALDAVGRDRIRALPLVAGLLIGFVVLAAPLVGGGWLGIRIGRWAATGLLAARCPTCSGASRQNPREIWGLVYLCSACGGKHWTASPAPWIVMGISTLVGIVLISLPFYLAGRRSIGLSESVLMVVTGVVVVQSGLLFGGMIPRLASRLGLPRDIDLAKLTVGVIVLQMVPATVMAMLGDRPERFPMGRPSAFAAMATSFWAGAWLVVSSLPPTPRRNKISSTLVSLLVTFFGLTAVAVALGGGRVFVIGAVLLLAVAARLWWNMLRTGRGPGDSPKPPSPSPGP